MCGASTSASSRFSGNSSNQTRKSRNRFPDAPSLSLSLFLFRVFGVSRQFPDRHFALAGLEDVLDESYDGDAEDELEPKFDDNPGTTRGTTFFRSAKNLLSLFDQPWLSTAGPLKGVSVVFAKPAQQYDSKRFLEQLHGYELILVMNEHLCLLVGVHFSIGSQHCRRVFWTFLLCPSLLSLILICSSCAPRPRIDHEFLWSFLKWAPTLPWLQLESKTKLFPYV